MFAEPELCSFLHDLVRSTVVLFVSLQFREAVITTIGGTSGYGAVAQWALWFVTVLVGVLLFTGSRVYVLGEQHCTIPGRG